MAIEGLQDLDNSKTPILLDKKDSLDVFIKRLEQKAGIKTIPLKEKYPELKELVKDINDNPLIGVDYIEK